MPRRMRNGNPGGHPICVRSERRGDGETSRPTMVLADGEGKIVRIFYGAPANLHEEIEKELKKIAA